MSSSTFYRDRPSDALTCMDGMWVKIGRNNRVFKWIMDDWILSTKQAEDVTGFIAEQNKKPVKRLRMQKVKNEG